MRRVAFEAQKRTWLLARKLEHLRRLRDRLGKLELTGVDALQVRSRPARAAARPSAGVPSACKCT